MFKYKFIIDSNNVCSNNVFKKKVVFKHTKSCPFIPLKNENSKKKERQKK